MSVYVIGDPHLSLGTDKPMDIFRGWKDYTERLRKNWESIVSENDTVVIPGDISWAMSLEEARTDLAFIDALPGRKIIGKGNHDYWWCTMKKMNAFLEENKFSTLNFLFNNAYEADDIAICGTRGWFFEEERSGQHDEKVFRRELMRLEASLASAGDLPKIVFLHYPPRYKGYTCDPILELFGKYDIRKCFYGHLHGGSHCLAMEGVWDGVEYKLVSADKLNFSPYRVF